MSMKHLEQDVVVNRQISEDMRELEFQWPNDAPEPAPGQFLTVRCTAGTDPLLRRPFAFSSIRHDPAGTGSVRRAGIIFQRRGKATELLGSLEPGDRLDLIGPLGTAFPLPEPGWTPVLVAGGVGIGPVLFLAERLAASSGTDRDTGNGSHAGAETSTPFAAADGSAETERYATPILIIGARSAALLPAAGALEDGRLEGVRIIRCTDDGSAGFHGTTLDAFLSLPIGERSRTHLYCCGPTPMMKALSLLAAELDIPCTVSMEQIMACAVGACMGCVIEVNSEKKFARVCTEGPVFDSRYVNWSAL